MSRRSVFFSFAAFFIAAVGVEAVSFLGVVYLGSKGAVYFPPSVTAAEYRAYRQERDPLLGWPPSQDFGAPDSGFDSSGSRRTPAFPDPRKTPPAVSAYGDSFTFGSEVDDEHAYPNVLSTLLKARVSNFGVGGYGTDQAYLRFHENASDAAPVVILGHTSENILRNVNRFRALLYSSEAFGLKPRFIPTAQGRLELLPMPEGDYAAYEKWIHDPARLRHEYFVPGGPSGIYRAAFPYSVTMVRTLFGNFHLRAKLAGEPWYAEFYRQDHSSGALAVTAGILKKFHDEALSRGRRPIVLFIPTGQDFLYYEKNKKWVYTPLAQKLAAEKIECIDAGPLLWKELDGKDPRRLFNDMNRHYNEAGCRLLAKAVFSRLKASVSSVSRLNSS